MSDQSEFAEKLRNQSIRLEALKLSRDIAVGNEAPAITLDRARQFHDFLTFERTTDGKETS